MVSQKNIFLNAEFFSLKLISSKKKYFRNKVTKKRREICKREKHTKK